MCPSNVILLSIRIPKYFAWLVKVMYLLQRNWVKCLSIRSMSWYFKFIWLYYNFFCGFTFMTFVLSLFTCILLSWVHFRNVLKSRCVTCIAILGSSWYVAVSVPPTYMKRLDFILRFEVILQDILSDITSTRSPLTLYSFKAIDFFIRGRYHKVKYGGGGLRAHGCWIKYYH